MLCDVTLTVDEGLVSLNLPLVRIAAKQRPRSEFLIYKRDKLAWSAGEGGKTRLRSWMSSLDQVRCDGAMFADFGYWKGAWQSDSRPGPFVVVFAPVWFAGLLAFGAFALLALGWIRFRLRSLLIATTVFAWLLYLLTQRAPA